MGEHLASLLMAAYGGHFWAITKNVDLLQNKKHDMEIVAGLSLISSRVASILKLYPCQSLPLFRQMAESGFAATDANDPVVEMIVKSNIGGIVSRSEV